MCFYKTIANEETIKNLHQLFMNGIVLKSTGNHYRIKGKDGNYVLCTIRGKFKTDLEITSTNPIAVGDNVVFQLDKDNETVGVITDILPRTNYIIRSSPHRNHQNHIIAANIDLAAVVATIVSPKTTTGFIDRFLVTAEAYHIPAIIVFNKADLINEKVTDEWREKVNMYQNAGYRVITVSAKTKIGLDILNEAIKNKTTLFSGHSGVGKSTLLNCLHHNLQIKTNEISQYSGKGQHTTTFAEMHEIDEHTRIIDTPGIKEFGITNIEKKELTHYFPEFRKYISNCKYNNCLHINEPQCAVKSALDNNQIAQERYRNYCNMLESLS